MAGEGEGWWWGAICLVQTGSDLNLFLCASECALRLFSGFGMVFTPGCSRPACGTVQTSDSWMPVWCQRGWGSCRGMFDVVPPPPLPSVVVW
jgi:hypothetical protein